MIPITRPYLGDQEVKAVEEVIRSGWVTQGPKIEIFEQDFANYVDSTYACAVSNCTSALHLSLIAIGVKPGDVVITVSHSFIATANAVRHCAAEPVFVDIDPKTYNMSPDGLSMFINQECEYRDNGFLYYKNLDKITSGQSPLAAFRGLESINGNSIGRVGAIMPVHQMGMPCDMQGILSVAQRYNIPVVEDAACALGSEISFHGHNNWDKIGRPHADIACFSFHPRKIITTGDGGMIVSNNKKYIAKLKLLRQHGMSISDVKRHSSRELVFERYVTEGWNYRLTDIQAAIGIEQLKKLPEIIQKRITLAKWYNDALSALEWLKTPYEPSWCKTNYQSYPVRISKPVTRNELMSLLLSNEIGVKPGIMNAHKEPPYLEIGWSLPCSEAARDEVILLPLYPGMQESDVAQITELIRNSS